MNFIQLLFFGKYLYLCPGAVYSILHSRSALGIKTQGKGDYRNPLGPALPPSIAEHKREERRERKEKKRKKEEKKKRRKDEEDRRKELKRAIAIDTSDSDSDAEIKDEEDTLLYTVESTAVHSVCPSSRRKWRWKNMSTAACPPNSLF